MSPRDTAYLHSSEIHALSQAVIALCQIIKYTVFGPNFGDGCPTREWIRCEYDENMLRLTARLDGRL
jgi:hypothetical protein